MKFNRLFLGLFMLSCYAMAQSVRVQARFKSLDSKEYNADDVIGDDDIRLKHEISGTWSSCSEKLFSSFWQNNTLGLDEAKLGVFPPLLVFLSTNQQVQRLNQVVDIKLHFS